MVRSLVPDVVENQKLLRLAPEASVREAAKRMARRNVRSVLVVKRGRLVGIFTGTDLIGRVVAAGRDPDTTTLAEVMTPNPETITPAENAIEALRRMQARRYRHLPIVENEKLVGILSRRDFLGYEIDEIEHQERIWQRI